MESQGQPFVFCCFLRRKLNLNTYSSLDCTPLIYSTTTFVWFEQFMAVKGSVSRDTLFFVVREHAIG